ncbi:hypothetical protein Emed_007420 [Eimeria media]
MGLGREALLEIHCGLPPEFRSPPLALKNTEVDENSPHPCTNSKPPSLQVLHCRVGPGEPTAERCTIARLEGTSCV